MSDVDVLKKAIQGGINAASDAGAGGAVLGIVELAIRFALDLLGHDTARVDTIVRGKIRVEIGP